MNSHITVQTHTMATPDKKDKQSAIQVHTFCNSIFGLVMGYRFVTPYRHT